MKTVYSTLGFALGASAASLVARDQCCFSLTAAGGKSGVVGQLGDGQNRIGQTAGLSTGQATYCINNGGLTDENGRGCILTPPTTQFQCDVGAAPTTGFAVSSSGDLTYNGNTQFYACATGDNGGYNIYTTTSSAESGCVKITLNTGGKCAGSNGSGSSSAASSKPASSAPASKPASSAPASSAPAPSKPASSAPASSAPAPLKPASSAPAPSAPASSAPASPMPASSAPAASPMTVYSTVTSTVYHCAASCTSAPSAPASMPASMPASSAPAPSAPASSAPAASKPASSAPAPSAPASSAASKPASSAPAPSAPASSVPASGTAGGNHCATTLSGAYQTPHAIIPVNKNSPSTSYGTQYDAYFSSANSTVFNFDIPSSYSGKQCSVIFLLPNKDQLVTSDFTLSGSGGIKFDQLSSPAPLSVSYATCPAVKSTLGMVDNVMPGNSYVVSTSACQAGSTISILASATGSLNLELFEDWNPSAIGLFITSC
ncbi:hypothetical protein KCU81_g6784, partial [Aureobasidium melanogenum]|uniref:Uncharacterized protein n=1 Tax=Aureobasidium melanogenum (strain CBS 110374) TaxID=1043003 RepID=A0A074VT47_AURM1